MRSECSVPPNAGASAATQLAAREAQGLVALPATTLRQYVDGSKAPTTRPPGSRWRSSATAGTRRPPGTSVRPRMMVSVAIVVTGHPSAVTPTRQANVAGAQASQSIGDPDHSQRAAPACARLVMHPATIPCAPRGPVARDRAKRLTGLIGPGGTRCRHPSCDASSVEPGWVPAGLNRRSRPGRVPTS
jgi:hypothetical protein